MQYVPGYKKNVSKCRNPSSNAGVRFQGRVAVGEVIFFKGTLRYIYLVKKYFLTEKGFIVTLIKHKKPNIFLNSIGSMR